MVIGVIWLEEFWDGELLVEIIGSIVGEFCRSNGFLRRLFELYFLFYIWDWIDENFILLR